MVFFLHMLKFYEQAELPQVIIFGYFGKMEWITHPPSLLLH